jgi:hypothetical protein
MAQHKVQRDNEQICSGDCESGSLSSGWETCSDDSTKESPRPVRKHKQQSVDAGRKQGKTKSKKNAGIVADSEVRSRHVPVSDTSHKRSSKHSKHHKRDAKARNTRVAVEANKFTVTFGPKGDHRWADFSQTPDAIKINGSTGPVLHVNRGSEYYFCVEQEPDGNGNYAHSFVLTEHPAGNVEGIPPRPLAFLPITNGCVAAKIDSCVPRYIFYQCAKHALEGGLVIVHDDHPIIH